MLNINRHWTIFVLLLSVGIMVILYGYSPEIVRAANQDAYLSYSEEGYIVNTRNNNVWTGIRSRIFTTPGEVQQYLAELRAEGNDAWRLPTKQELHDLLLIFDLKNNGDVKFSIEGAYWLTNEKGELSAGAWEVGDGCGLERVFYSKNKGHIIAVRP
ncbi:hypothetical protein [Desulfogranum japonicum]|uniref:hypothetical protein n=1 Tax=Desulfogranum japonicum TaxID=231447 RepID=UPI00048C2FD9|nr:hypothetical protein [Desulfogranum japonicum]